ncbi:hypothetical protein HD596_002911 [Nonomuraea jabiensis]|uniref:Uncharacterized protein n=1 Tax=Nonomuraea jabiensis TaxID=882448 RepID=A0A7W9LA06_9ACTN|nr:hypothetical protein [Nonomuraea jabiensis]
MEVRAGAGGVGWSPSRLGVACGMYGPPLFALDQQQPR